MILENAQQMRRDAFVMLVDFSEAFDTLDHDKQLQILYDLGYPTDAIEVVKDLYTGATTSIRLPGGETGRMPVNRGTIQGDSLSPFLFINYLEPLLRWLRVGDRGYHLDMPQLEETRTAEHVPDITYADDLSLLTGKTTDMKVQAGKVDTYSDWSCLKPNCGKTVLTGILHATHKTDPCNLKRLTQVLRQQDIRIGGDAPPILGATEPFKLLGVYCTMNLSWTTQYQHTLNWMKQDVKCLLQSCATPGQKRKLIQTSIRPKLRYGFYVAPYATPQLKAFDSILTTAYKNTYGLKPWVSTAMAHEDINRGGLGCTSVTADYVTVRRWVSPKCCVV
jgi:hypothetical protein